MKKIFLLAVAILFVTVCVCEAQNKSKKETVKVNFYGVDFSSVNVVGADETEDKFMTAFAGINQLLISEQSKYNVGKFLNLDILSLQIGYAIEQIDKLKDVTFKDNKDSKISLEEIIKSYPATEENSLFIVAKELNKSTNTGTFIAVIFDANKQIIYEQEFSGKAGGFGLRNFWANALYNGLKTGIFAK